MMTNEHYPLVISAQASPPAVASSRLVQAFFTSKSDQTLKAYRADLEDFTWFLGLEQIDQSAARLLGGGHGPANELALAYRSSLVERKLSAATVNRRLASVRSLIKLARTLGLVSWTLEVPSIKSESYRDTRGPGRGGVRQLFDLASSRGDGKGTRDCAILRLCYDLGLRRKEVTGLDLEDLDLVGKTIAIMGKGRTQKVLLTLPDPTLAAIQSWLVYRGNHPGPMFTNYDRAGKGDRLTGAAVYHIVRTLGERAGFKTRPHGLRHASITEVLDLSNGDLRAAARFSRHKDIRVLGRYDDSRLDMAGDLAKRLAAGL